MCGIVGVLQYKSEIPREIRQRALKILFSDTMLKTETRGLDATGLYQVHSDGDWAMTKTGIRASEWLFLDGKTSEDPVVYSDFMDSWLDHPQELAALVGHCRKATMGSRGRDNDDNHPFAVQLDERDAILGIHNGTLDNHELIFKNLPQMLKRQGQVDSEAIFHLLFHLSEHGTKPWDGGMLKTMGKRLDGSAACVVVNTRFPHLVATWRFGRPMEYFLLSPLNMVIICSERKFVESALEKYDLYRMLFDHELPELEKYDTALTERDFRIFDTSKPWPAGKPGFKDLPNISTRGDMKPFSGGMEAGWYTPTTTPASTGGAGTSQAYGRGGYAAGSQAAIGAGTGTQAKTTKLPGAASAQALSAAADASRREDDDTAVVVEVEIGNQGESQEALERAKSMGICTHYDSSKEIGDSLGITADEVAKLNHVELSNLVAKSHFNFGYAVSRFDTRSSVEATRKKGRELTRRLEKAGEKKLRAESKIWELKHLATVMLALSNSGYVVNEENIDLSLSAFDKLPKSRREDILKRARTILTDRSVLKVANQLRARYRQAKQKVRAQKESAATPKD